MNAYHSSVDNETLLLIPQIDSGHTRDILLFHAINNYVSDLDTLLLHSTGPFSLLLITGVQAYDVQSSFAA